MNKFKKLKKMIVATVISLSLVVMLGGANMALAAPVDCADGASDILGVGCASDTGLKNTDIRTMIASIISIALSLIGTVVVVIIIWAGFRWMTAGGNSDQVETAKTQLGQAVIGLAIILAAYSITQFVTSSLLTATK